MSPARPTRIPTPAEHFVGAGAWRHGLRYGLLGLPLAFVALPLYVILPNHYARSFGAPLAALGLVLLLARLFDALLDPLIGRWCDRLFARSSRAVLAAGAGAAVALALGLWALLFPPEAVRADLGALLAWAGGLMALTYTAYSVASVAHQTWGARLAGNEAQRSRITAWREGLALLGVLLAAVLPGTLGLGATVTAFAVLLALGWWAWSAAVVPLPGSPATPAQAGMPARRSPLRQPRFLKLLVVFVLNGTASAVPATLVLFFVQDRLQAPTAIEPAFLATYFLFAALSLPLWVRLVGRLGLARTWLAGMALAVGVFVWAATLGEGDVWPFLVVCALSGLALGTDLALPGALLTGLMDELGERGRREGAYLGWWNFAAKLNLALAAGLSLPLLALFGYSPGARDPAALQVLTLAYCLLPCVLKLLAGAALHTLVIRPGHRTEAPTHTPLKAHP
ncbi:major facilitator superfamily transporter [Hydrogenophaga taeniospiralis CCUG 15921]|uniref:Major facilitator superfamily transporter n=1 Tax=Hydrogenophaga taeniospiralis CCUG 15921 TaxID=1281780 RepID=A0A9X4NWR6_9BURK|nr:MFS transporter [Hydrogenophaga taeniospiralis]MDG5975915.1 major facilitator superfamily transporter [Hydrogenophaga taeniospiralis CCUG 15921]